MEIHRYCTDEDEEVPYEEIANGYETDDDDLVILTDAELATAAPRKTRTIEIEAFVDLEDVDPTYLRPPVRADAGRRRRRNPARLPAAARGDGAHRARGPGALRPAHQGVPGADPRAFRPARVDDDAVARRGAPGRGCPDADEEGQAGQEGGRRRGRADRRAVVPVGSVALRGPLREAAEEDHPRQGQGQDDRGPRGRRRSPRRSRISWPRWRRPWLRSRASRAARARRSRTPAAGRTRSGCGSPAPGGRSTPPPHP